MISSLESVKESSIVPRTPAPLPGRAYLNANMGTVGPYRVEPGREHGEDSDDDLTMPFPEADWPDFSIDRVHKHCESFLPDGYHVRARKRSRSWVVSVEDDQDAEYMGLHSDGFTIVAALRSLCDKLGKLWPPTPPSTPVGR